MLKNEQSLTINGHKEIRLPYGLFNKKNPGDLFEVPGFRGGYWEQFQSIRF